METNPDVIIDYITGQSVPNVGAEANRQRVERYLVENRGYRPEEVLVDLPIVIDIDGVVYRSAVDLVVQIDGLPLMAIKCAAGSMGSREREIISAARLLRESPLPLAVVSDGAAATVLDGVTGKKKGEGLEAIPHRQALAGLAAAAPAAPMAAERLYREKLVFRSYDSMNVNVSR